MISDPITVAVITYLKRQARVSYPKGFVKHTKWYPQEVEERPCCLNIRQPSHSYPWSLMTHCRSLKHVCNLLEVDEKEVRLRLTKKGLPLLVGSGDTWLDKWLDQKFRQETIC